MVRHGAERIYNFWVIACPAPDVPGQWTAHCPDLDVVTQGNSLEHVVDMVDEAIAMVVSDDLEQGRDPLDRRAPEAEFANLYALFDRGEQITLEDAQRPGRKIEMIAFLVALHVRAPGTAAPLTRAIPLGFTASLSAA